MISVPFVFPFMRRKTYEQKVLQYQQADRKYIDENTKVCHLESEVRRLREENARLGSAAVVGMHPLVPPPVEVVSHEYQDHSWQAKIVQLCIRMNPMAIRYALSDDVIDGWRHARTATVKRLAAGWAESAEKHIDKVLEEAAREKPRGR